MSFRLRFKRRAAGTEVRKKELSRLACSSGVGKPTPPPPTLKKQTKTQ